MRPQRTRRAKVRPRAGRRAATLIIVAGLLVVLAAAGASMYSLCRMQSRAAIYMGDHLRAEMLAKAGLDDAISRLRAQAFEKTEDPTDPWFTVSYMQGRLQHTSYEDGKNPYARALGSSAGPGSDRYVLKVEDAASKINVNACDNLAVVLDNLCRLLGPPLAPADQSMIQPRRWSVEGAAPGLYDKNTKDAPANLDLYYSLDAQGRPVTSPTTGVALYGDGYAIAGYRGRNGPFRALAEIKQALTFIDRDGDGKPNDLLEQMQIAGKYAMLEPYLTVHSWVDTSTVCVGKFEWADDPPYGRGDPIKRTLEYYKLSAGDKEEKATGVCQILIDRDKSWVAGSRYVNNKWELIPDSLNERGDLRGCYLSIMNGHGAGQLRRIVANGTDWVAIEDLPGLTVCPGPVSSYMIVAREDAQLEAVVNRLGQVACLLPKTSPDGAFVDHPRIDYSLRPLSIHRSPVNINTASEKVIAALFMGINVSHGHFMAVGTNADRGKLEPAKLKPRESWKPADYDWKIKDYKHRKVEPYILTAKGLKRIPADPGKLTLDRPAPDTDPRFAYIWERSAVAAGYFERLGTNACNEAHELAYRVIVAREEEKDRRYLAPETGRPAAAGNEAYRRGPFRSWDDFYFRVIQPWDRQRVAAGRVSIARILMANFNSNTDILKYNPNIEWIDRWGRNFTEMEPVMVYTHQAEQSEAGSMGHGRVNSSQASVGDVRVCDQDGELREAAIPVWCRERAGWGGASGSAPLSVGVFGTPPEYLGTYVTRCFRYRSDELLDKTDLNRSTAEFSFNSGGTFELAAVGQVLAPTGSLVAEYKIESLIQSYDVWRESTQRQFVRGRISKAEGARGTTYSGQVAQDGSPANDGSLDYRLALVTLPEPLVPRNYEIRNVKNLELVDTAPGSTTRSKRTAWGEPVPIQKPDVLANRVLPAGYDGQIVLATNTSRYDPTGADADSFLASFNGDVDTETCRGNGHEQAKTPLDCTVRVSDGIGLLGALNDTHIDMDPGLRGYPSSTNPVQTDLPKDGKLVDEPPPLEIYRFRSIRNALRGLNPDFYWNTVSCRQGDLRTDGVWVGGPGVAAQDGVLKYPCGDFDRPITEINCTLNGSGFQQTGGPTNRGTIGNVEGFLLSTWAKTTWRQNDNRNHEFFDCTQPGWNSAGIRAHAFWLRKYGQPNWGMGEKLIGGGGDITDVRAQLQAAEDGTWGISGCGNRMNDLCLAGEFDQVGSDQVDPDWNTSLHGGSSLVPLARQDPDDPRYQPESPAYRIQPFRWHFLGLRIYLGAVFRAEGESASRLPSGAGSRKSGYWKKGGNYNWCGQSTSKQAYQELDTLWLSSYMMRPFVDSERGPEGPDYNSEAKFWTGTQVGNDFSVFQTKGRKGVVTGATGGGQHVRWYWASPGGTATRDGKTIENHTIFGMNNCNPGMGYQNGGGSFTSIYRSEPSEGTYAILDEYKISFKETVLRQNALPPRDQGGTDLFPKAGDKLDWSRDRIARSDATYPGEQTLSRYYLPPDPAGRRQCPTFTSQSLFQSLKTVSEPVAGRTESVTVARVSWNAFTPRFMSEYKRPGASRPLFSRSEVITLDADFGNLEDARHYQTTRRSVPFKGPFDCCKYNDIKDEKKEKVSFDDQSYDRDPKIFPYRCGRPAPAAYPTGQSHATRGVEVELLDDLLPIPAQVCDRRVVPPLFVKADLGVEGTPSVLTNPDWQNRFGDGAIRYRVRTDRLRYRVRFRYPTDPLADPYTGPWVNPSTQYLLDTPVFDDIAVTYVTALRILDYRVPSE